MPNLAMFFIIPPFFEIRHERKAHANGLFPAPPLYLSLFPTPIRLLFLLSFSSLFFFSLFLSHLSRLTHLLLFVFLCPPFPNLRLAPLPSLSSSATMGT